MSEDIDEDEDTKESNEYYKIKGNPLDGYWRDLGSDPMDYDPFMARLGFLILYVMAAVLVTSIFLSL